MCLGYTDMHKRHTFMLFVKDAYLVSYSSYFDIALHVKYNKLIFSQKSTSLLKSPLRKELFEFLKKIYAMF